jgi:hypothetical protein
MRVAKDAKQADVWTQSIDKMQTSVPLSAAEHLRLRGGAPSRRRSQVSGATQQQVSPPQQSAQETASPSHHQKQATAPAQAENEADQQKSSISQPSSGPTHEYHEGDLIEVTFTHVMYAPSMLCQLGWYDATWH